MHKALSGRPVMTVRHRIEVAEDRGRPRKNPRFRIKSDQKPCVLSAVVRPHEKAVAILGKREDDDVLEFSLKVRGHRDRVVELRDVRVDVERIIEDGGPSQKNGAMFEYRESHLDRSICRGACRGFYRNAQLIEANRRPRPDL